MKPFVKSNKNDFVDAEAIAEAVERKNMRFVPIKTDDQLDLQAIHRVRDRLISRRTAVINQLRAFLLGGYAGTWVPAVLGDQLELSHQKLAEVGASLGAGIVFALPSSACAVSEIAFVARWMAGQSAGQCGPCVFGLDAIATALDQVRSGAGGEGALGRIRRWASLASGRGACAHPDGAARFIISATEVFADELADHAGRGACAGCLQHHLLPTPVAATNRQVA